MSAEETWASPAELQEAEQAVGIWRAIREAIWECDLDMTCKLVALRLVEHLPNIEMSVASIARYTTLTERAVQKALRRLESYRIVISLPVPGQRSKYQFVGQPEAVTPEPRSPLPPNHVHRRGEPRSPLTPEPRSPKADPDLKQTKEAEKSAGAPASSLPLVLRTLPEDFVPSDELIANVVMQGLSKKRFLERLDELGDGPIGGARGVLSHKLDSHLLKLAAKWRAWDANDAAKNAKALGKTNDELDFAQ